MNSRSITHPSLKALSLMGVVLACGLALAPSSAQDVPLARTATDSDLSWGPCPAFMPEGCGIAVLHGDPAGENADILFRVPANSVIPRHWHTSAERIVMLSGELHVTYDGHETAVLTAGAYAYGPARLPHHGECKDAGPCVLFIAFESPLDAVAVDGEAVK